MSFVLPHRSLALLTAAFVVLFCLTAAPAVPARADGKRQAKRELERLEQKWSDAFNSGDAAALNRLLDDRFVCVSTTGEVLDKAAYVDLVVNHLHVISGGIFDLDIRVHGSTGIVTARFTGRTSYDGVESDVSFRFIDVWAKRNGRWKAVSTQDTTIADSGSG